MAAGMHQSDKSGGATFFGCAYCHEVYAKSGDLEVHQRMTHPDLPPCVVPAPMPGRAQQLLHKAPVAAISRGVPMSEVARHCTPADCWVALNGKVFDLTEFMDRHPGGPTTVLNWAGKDASKIFNDIHKGVKIDQYLRPESFVGTLGIDEDLMTESYWHTLRKARIEEIKDELARVTQGEALPERRDSIARILEGKTLHKDIEAKVRSLETQKRVALDFEDFGKAKEIRKKIDELLSLAQVPSLNKASGGGIPLSEVALHNKPHDCWVAVSGKVYDLTDFLIQHPEQRNSVLAWAGRDATPMWNKIPGRFPSQTWMDFFLRPEACMGAAGPEPAEDPKERQVRELREELRRLEGPSEEDIQAHKAAAASAKTAPLASQAASQLSEEARFPRLRDVAAKRTVELPFYTRAEVAKHAGPAGGPPGTEPWMILHNRVYDLTPLLGNHPGGDDVLLASAGKDATKEFELFEHSEKARVRRDQDMLVGELVPAEHTDWAAEAQSGGMPLEGAAVGAASSVAAKESDLMCYLRYKAADALLACLGLYMYRSWQHRKPLSKLMYSRGLRHLHLIMAVGMVATIGSVQAAARSEGLVKKRYLQLHKQSGIAMFAALLVRIYLRLKSGIPPRFPSHPAMQFVETQSLRLFYVLMLVLPVSGMANEYFLKWAPGTDQTGRKEDDERNDQLAKQSLDLHKRVGKFFEYAWLPFHLGYTTAYHYSMGRGVVRKVSPFI